MNSDIELNPIDFITFGTVGPKGRRVFYLQAGQDEDIITLTVEKQQAKAIGEAVTELLDDLAGRFPLGSESKIQLSEWNMDLREPIDPLFRVAQVGLGYDESQNKIVLVAQELINPEDDQIGLASQPRLVRMWGSRSQFRALGMFTQKLVSKGRADPKSNGRIIYYWT
jgi:uncharacterized repeat protein (TIGR03847 family)